MGEDWTELFDSPLLALLTGLSALSWFAIFFFGRIAGGDPTYIVLLIAGATGGGLTYIMVSGLPDWPEDVEGIKIITYGLLGFAGIVFISFLVSGVVGRPASAVWVPENIIPLQVAVPGASQAALDIAVLWFLVAPAERGMVAIGSIFTRATKIGSDLPIYAQPGFLATTGLWAGMHVVFGQNPAWFGFVAFGAGLVMLWAAHMAQDYTVALISHGLFDVVARSYSFLLGGGLSLSFS